MSRLINRVGVRYGRLVVLLRTGTSRSKKVLWQCRCDCGKVVVVDACSLVTGNTTSCGCFLQERITKHGGWKKASYNTWRAMMRRCYNPKDKDYRKYGALGVTVHAPWHDYLTFAAAVGEPEGTQTLDRENTYGDYVPGNVRWATPTTQARNIRVRPSSVSGFTGVYPVKNRWIAALTCNGRRWYSSMCDTVEAAAQARKQLELTHWGA
jgi:hypothetical protein